MSDPVKPQIIVEDASIRPPGPLQGGAPPMGGGTHRGLAIVRLPDGRKRYWEQWFTQAQIDHAPDQMIQRLRDNAVRDAEQYAGASSA